MRFLKLHLKRQEETGALSSRRYFWWKKSAKRKEKSDGRPGALTSSEVERRVKEIGVGRQIQIIRIGYDGKMDDIPIIVEVTNISAEGFSGHIVNLEREMIENATEKLVFARKGGGFIEFRFDDGDIKDIIETKDEELLEQERSVEELKEILSALDVGDRIIVAYYDPKKKGTLNIEGILTEKSVEENSFVINIEKIEKIELEKKFSKAFDIQNDVVIDIVII